MFKTLRHELVTSSKTTSQYFIRIKLAFHPVQVPWPFTFVWCLDCIRNIFPWERFEKIKIHSITNFLFNTSIKTIQNTSTFTCIQLKVKNLENIFYAFHLINPLLFTFMVKTTNFVPWLPPVSFLMKESRVFIPRLKLGWRDLFLIFLFVSTSLHETSWRDLATINLFFHYQPFPLHVFLILIGWKHLSRGLLFKLWHLNSNLNNLNKSNIEVTY